MPVSTQCHLLTHCLFIGLSLVLILCGVFVLSNQSFNVGSNSVCSIDTIFYFVFSSHFDVYD